MLTGKKRKTNYRERNFEGKFPLPSMEQTPYTIEA